MRVDLKQVEQDLTSERIIQLVCGLGADRYEEKNDYIIFPTICHNEDAASAKMKLYYYKKNHRFHCYTDCGENFNIYQLFEKRYELLNIEYDFFKDIVLKIVDGQELVELDEGFLSKYKKIGDKYTRQKIEVNLNPLKENLLNIYTFYPTVEWLNDGISEDSMRIFNIKYDVLHNKIIIPHYDENNNLIGIRGRALNDEDLIYGKYMPVTIEGTIYSHPLGYNLYGLNKNKDNIRKRKTAIVFEAEKSVLQYETMYGRDNNIAVAVCGSSLSAYQIELLIRAGAENIIIAFDAPGDMSDEGRDEHYNVLQKICKRFYLKSRIGFIDDRKSLLRAKESPTDRGKVIFEELIKHIIWIN